MIKFSVKIFLKKLGVSMIMLTFLMSSGFGEIGIALRENLNDPADPANAPAQEVVIESCTADELLTAETSIQTRESSLGGTLENYEYPETQKTENNISLTIIENKSPLLGVGVEYAVEIMNNTGEQIFNI